MGEARDASEDWTQLWWGGAPEGFRRTWTDDESWMQLGEGLIWLAPRFRATTGPRRLEGEPACWMYREDRVLLAGVAEFFARRFSLPRPQWVD